MQRLDAGRILKEEVELPASMPNLRGIRFATRAKLDTDHASDTVTTRSMTEFIVYANNSSIYWHSKK